MLTHQETTTSRSSRAQLIGVAALLSLAAGFLHAAVIDSHRDHGVAAQLFTAIAVFQVAWAALAIAKPTRPVLLAGAIGNGAVALGYFINRTVGIGFIDGFQEPEEIGFTDAVTTALEVLVVVVAALVLVAGPDRRLWPAGRLGVAGFGTVGLAVALIAVPAAAAVGSAGGHGSHGEEASGHGDHGASEASGAHGDHSEAATGGEHSGGGSHSDHQDMSYFDSLRTATPEQRAAAEQLLTETRDGLWQWTDDEKVYAAGFRSINDGATGTEHLVNWRWINDDVVLDPDKPESLVYRVGDDGKKYLEAAMFMAPAGTPDDEVPDVGGPITQWHIHNNLCYSPERLVDGAPQRSVVGLTSGSGQCRRGEFLSPHAPMLHVWTVEHECGPFSSLEGVGAGQGIDESQDPNADPGCQHSSHG